MSKNMSEELKGKKILILGGMGYSCDVVKQAKEMGVYTVVTDYIPNSPAKSVADKAYDVSTTDVDALEKLCRDEEIDGIFVGWSDTNHYMAEEVCRRMGFPFYANYEQLRTFTDKILFKETCKKYGVSTVPEFKLTAELNEDDVAKLQFPVIIKPCDSYGGKGITICNSKDEIADAVDEALSMSKSKQFIVEKYMDDENYDTICLYYTIQDGIPALSAMTDRYMQRFGDGKRLNTSIIYPSQYLPRYISEMDECVKAMLKGEGLHTGTIFLEGCVDSMGFYLWESGYRLCAAQQNIFPAYFNGVDVQRMLICYALTGRMADENVIDKENPYFGGRAACNGLVFLKPGELCSADGVDEIKNMKNIINFTQLLKAGDIVKESDVGTLCQSFARFHAVAENNEELRQVIKDVFGKLNIKDKAGNDMVICNYDYDEIFGKKRWAKKQ